MKKSLVMISKSKNKKLLEKKLTFDNTNWTSTKRHFKRTTPKKLKLNLTTIKFAIYAVYRK